MSSGAKCSVVDCNARVHARAYCAKHYARWLKHGSPYVDLKTGAGPAQRWMREHMNFKGEECLTWPFRISDGGYGTITHKGRGTNAHRVMCILVNGEPPFDGAEAAHLCGNRSCVNPRHLAWKTPAENMADKVIHGTDHAGERNAAAKLNWGDVRAMRALKGKMTTKEIGLRFGVSKAQASKILSGKSWIEKPLTPTP